jgi:hypothetical protein
VYDAAGAPVAFRVLANDAGVFSAEVRGAVPGATYYVAVSARTPDGANATGAYFLGADFNRLAPTEHTQLAAGAAAPGATPTGTLTVTRGGTHQFALSAEQLGGAGGVVAMTVTDAAGRVVLTLEAATGRPLTTAVRFLDAGTCTIRYATRGAGSLPPGTLGYGLFLLKLSDDMGPRKSTTTMMEPSTTSTTTSPAPAPAPTDSTESPDSTSYQYNSTGDGYYYDGSSRTYSAGTPYYF